MCLVRPPGHHAGYEGLDEAAGGCGFCVVNSAVVGAAYALEAHKGEVERVAIVDLDVHHGNGTEDIVRRLTAPAQPEGGGGGEAGVSGRAAGGLAGKLWYGSVHLREKFDDPDQDFFPGSGDSSEEGRIVNLPLSPLWSPPTMLPHLGRGREAWRGRVEELLGAVERFGPSLVVVSMGFDAAEGDEGSTQDGAVGLDLKQGDFEWAGSKVGALAARECQGRVVTVLEGGYGAWDADREQYDRSDLASNCVAYLRGLHAAAARPPDPAASHDPTSASHPHPPLSHPTTPRLFHQLSAGHLSAGQGARSAAPWLDPLDEV